MFLFVTSALGSTLVGNPTGVVLHVGPGSDVVVRHAYTHVEHVTVEYCGGPQQTWWVHEDADLVAGWWQELPADNVCMVEIALDAPVHVEADAAGVGEWATDVPLGIIKTHLSPGWQIAATGPVLPLQLGDDGWVDAASLSQCGTTCPALSGALWELIDLR
jgi:hypothetical protein